MVKIINYKEREKEDGTTFFTLEIQGGVELIQSKETGNFYATIRRASIPTTFDEATCKSVIGTEIEGEIVKIEVEPFKYVVKETGEEVTLTHRWIYKPVQDKVIKQSDAKPQSLDADFDTFSKNGVNQLETAF